MSYLQPLCAHHQLRGELLQAFRFECTCTRCMGERQSEEGAGEGAGEVVRVLQRLLEGMDAGGASARVGELLLRADSVTAESEARTGSGTGTGDGPLWAFGSSTSVAHDAASVALQVSLAALGGQNQGKLGQPGKQGKQGQGPGQGQWEHLHYAVRAGLILSRCWHLSGCGLLLQRAEFVISCGGFALQLSASPHSPSHSHSSPSVLVCAAKEDLQTVAYSLDNLSIYLNQGTATATATGTAAYIQLLLTRARALLKQL
ncbi:hypothetical protein B484DRAFT_176192 [Ochromonadaceae sp. CCMP2298]|nr:hypothetical protein B484DRAFT_176192 [Ochromonadaceae sp. CCMP2298]